MHAATNRERKETGRAKAPAWCAGHAVLDPEGRKIGVAKEVFANGRGEPEYVRVGMGAFGLKRVLIPVQLVALDEKRRTITLQ